MLDDTIFTALGSGGQRALGAANFVVNAGGNALDSNDFIAYDTATGNLYYDADGNGSGSRVLFAHIDLGGLAGTVDVTDFFII